MATVARITRDSPPGGLNRYLDRSRSRGDNITERGRDYGRGNHSAKFEDREKDNTRGDSRRGEEPEKEMHGKGGGSGFGGDRGYGGGGGYRDRGDRNEGGGYRDRGGQRDRGGDRGYAGGGGGGFHGGPKVSTVAEGQKTAMLSNHFRFSTKTQNGNIYIYSIDYGVFDDRS